MDNKELEEAVKSQRNRYAALLVVIQNSANPVEDPCVWTLIEDGAEFGLHLVTDVCAVET
jgi:hypothetical protein